MPNRRKRKAPRGERGASALIKSSKGLGETHSAGAETALLTLRTPARLDEFRGDALLPVSTKTALYSTAGRPISFLSGVDTYRQNQLASRCLMASANRSDAPSGVKLPMPVNLSKV